MDDPVKPKSIRIKMPKGIYHSLSMNNCSYESLLSELTDNVAAELIHCTTADVEITIAGPWYMSAKNKCLDLANATIEIRDNATGIEPDRIAECLELSTVASHSKDSLHEHGYGMKTAIFSLGELDYMVTKTKKNKVGYRIEEITPEEDIPIIEDKTTFEENESGTLIKIKHLKDKVYNTRGNYTRNLINQLGARYSRLLVANHMTGRKLSIRLKLCDEFGNPDVDGNGVPAVWDIVPIKPYFTDDIAEIDQEFSGDGWGAHLKFGLAAKEAEYIQNGLPVPTTNHPYKEWAKLVDIVIHDRILTRQSVDQLLEHGYGNYFVTYIGVLTLRYGFRTSLTKDGVFHDKNWAELKEKIKTPIQDFMKKHAHKEKMREESEANFRDQLHERWLKGDEKHVCKEYSVEGIDGYIDLLSFDKPENQLTDTDKGMINEIKAEQAKGLDVYQILYYLDNCDRAKKDEARLIAPSFSDGCIRTAENLKKKGITIKLKTFKDMDLKEPTQKPNKKKKE